MDDEAAVVGGRNHSHATQDLYDTIASGEYPEWQLLVQTMDPAVRAGPPQGHQGLAPLGVGAAGGAGWVSVAQAGPRAAPAHSNNTDGDRGLSSWSVVSTLHLLSIGVPSFRLP